MPPRGFALPALWPLYLGGSSYGSVHSLTPPANPLALFLQLPILLSATRQRNLLRLSRPRLGAICPLLVRKPSRWRKSKCRPPLRVMCVRVGGRVAEASQERPSRSISRTEKVMPVGTPTRGQEGFGSIRCAAVGQALTMGAYRMHKESKGGFRGPRRSCLASPLAAS